MNLLHARISFRFSFRRVGLCFLACVLSVVRANGFAQAPSGNVQAPAKNALDGNWQGILHAGKDLRTIVKITTEPNGALKSMFYSIDQGGEPIPVKRTTFANGEMQLDVELIGGVFTGKLADNGNALAGEWKQGDQPLPLTLVRATPATAWTIPAPPPRVEPMKADADPSFEVATIKPSSPDEQGKGFGGPPGRFMTRNTTLDDLIMFAYGVHTKQIANGPDWLYTQKFDIDGKPDTPGAANEQQNRTMMRKLLVSRFGLEFHKEQRDLPAFVLTVAKNGPKLEKSDESPDTPTTFLFRGLGNLLFRNITMDGFAGWMQTVLDRPVVNRTNLEGRFQGVLKWNPDETQFAIFGPPPHPSTAPDAPPDLYKAVQEQIGLKLTAERTPVTVMVLDHVHEPSSN